MDTFRIIMYIIITIVIVLLVYTKMHNDIKTQIIKINSAESKIDESLRQKYDLLVYHNAPSTKSNIITRGVNMQDGSLLFNVTGMVYNGIKDCTIEQNNRILKIY